MRYEVTEASAIFVAEHPLFHIRRLTMPPATAVQAVVPTPVPAVLVCVHAGVARAVGLKLRVYAFVFMCIRYKSARHRYTLMTEARHSIFTLALK